MKKIIYVLLFIGLSGYSQTFDGFLLASRQQFENQTPSYDTDAQAFITAVGTLTTSQQTAINNLVLGLKTNGTWSKYKVIYPFIGGTALSHKWNLKDPRDLNAAFRLTYSGTITHNANGITGNGTNGSANTYFVPSVETTYNSEALTIYCNSNNTPIDGDAIDVGSFVSVSRVSLMAIKGTTQFNTFQSRMNNQLLMTSNTDARGCYTVNKNGSTTLSLNKNGSQVFSGTSAGTLPNLPLFLLSLNLFGNPYGFTNQTQAFTGFSSGLTTAEISNDFIVIQEYQTALGRNN